VGGDTNHAGVFVFFQLGSPLKKSHPEGMSNMALDTIVQCYVGQACPTGLSDMGLDNSVRCHVKQTWFNGFFQHGIGQFWPIVNIGRNCQKTLLKFYLDYGFIFVQNYLLYSPELHISLIINCTR
jgi:hypothetical protein